MRRTAALLLVVAGLGAGCNTEGVGRHEARLSFGPGGQALVAESGRPFAQEGRDRTLHQGARVRLLTGTATLALAGGPSLELREDSIVRLGTLPTLVTGEAVVFATEDPVTVVVAGTRVVVSGVARVSRDLAVSAASYRGQLTLESAGRSLRIPALRQAAVPSLGVLPEAPRPLVYDASDPWDRRFLGPAIDLGAELEAKSQGFTVSVAPGEGSTPESLRRLVPELAGQPEFGAGLLSPTRPPGETLVGATIVALGQRGTFASRWSEVFSFREQGAAWGLVALDQGVTDAASLIGALDAAIARAPLAFTGPVPPAPPVPTGSARPPGTTPSRTRPSPAARPAPSRSGPPASPPVATPTPRPRGALDPVVEPLVDTLSGVLSRL